MNWSSLPLKSYSPGLSLPSSLMGILPFSSVKFTLFRQEPFIYIKRPRYKPALAREGNGICTQLMGITNRAVVRTLCSQSQADYLISRRRNNNPLPAVKNRAVLIITLAPGFAGLHCGLNVVRYTTLSISLVPLPTGHRASGGGLC